MKSYKAFEGTASNLERGWMKGDFYSPDGTRVCLVQGALEALGLGNGILPAEIEAQLDTALMQFRSYRFFRSLALTKPQDPNAKYRMFRYPPIQQAMMMWNDMPWRRQRTVVSLVQSLQIKAALNEISDLRIQLINLQAENNRLKATIERLERENRHLWKRLLNYGQLPKVREAQAEVNGQLDAVDYELGELIKNYAPADA